MSKEKVIDISTRKTGKIVGICAAAVAAIIVVVSSVSIVPAGCTGVVTTFGKVSDTALNEGLHLKVPFAQRVTTVSPCFTFIFTNITVERLIPGVPSHIQ